MALLPTNAGFDIDFEEVKPTDKVFYEAENNKITQLLSNDQYLMKCLDEIRAKFPVDIILNHNLNRYPIVQVMQSGYGAGRGGAGAIPAGGNNISALFRYSFLDSNRLEIYLPIKLDNPQIQKIDDMNYILRSDSVAYQIFLT